jgi:ribosomal protein L29
MAILKSKDIIKMTEKEMNDKIKELQTEMVKARVSVKKAGKANLGEMKKAIARLLTRKNQNEKNKTGGKADKK